MTFCDQFHHNIYHVVFNNDAGGEYDGSHMRRDVKSPQKDRSVDTMSCWRQTSMVGSYTGV